MKMRMYVCHVTLIIVHLVTSYIRPIQQALRSCIQHVHSAILPLVRLNGSIGLMILRNLKNMRIEMIRNMTKTIGTKIMPSM